MTRVTTTPLAVSADYADALLAARRAKNWLFMLLLLFLLIQLTIFFLVRFDVVKLGPGGQATLTTPTDVDVDADVDVETPTTSESPATGESPTTSESPTTLENAVPTPSLMAVAQAGADADFSVEVGKKDITTSLLAWVTNSIVYLGTIFSILMAIVILLIVLIMLVGRLIGVSHSTSAFIWMALLALILFPWQLCYGPETSRAGTSAHSAAATSMDSSMNDFRLPGVLYTWGELREGANFSGQPFMSTIHKWMRFAGFPMVALLILFMVQAKSGRAVKFALGEAEVHVDVATTDV